MWTPLKLDWTAIGEICPRSLLKTCSATTVATDFSNISQHLCISRELVVLLQSTLSSAYLIVCSVLFKNKGIKIKLKSLLFWISSTTTNRHFSWWVKTWVKTFSYFESRGISSTTTSKSPEIRLCGFGWALVVLLLMELTEQLVESDASVLVVQLLIKIPYMTLGI